MKNMKNMYITIILVVILVLSIEIITYAETTALDKSKNLAASKEYAISASLNAERIEQANNLNGLSQFLDSNKVISKANENGIIKGYDDKTLLLQSTVCRVEEFVILAQMLSVKKNLQDAIKLSDLLLCAKDDIDSLNSEEIVCKDINYIFSTFHS
ncbi:hypothetical protein PIROE2DRAFT_3622 [Piromyces sp. E2]|nr:hypothetical protein PIROE2DRAFT_3622 [Piromyces sp. E2]|eukprot:OUM68631.1 hypothetical protein PIROE2DRAFT_3622 [Piromyces sp. E2]